MQIQTGTPGERLLNKNCNPKGPFLCFRLLVGRIRAAADARSQAQFISACVDSRGHPGK